MPVEIGRSIPDRAFLGEKAAQVPWQEGVVRNANFFDRYVLRPAAADMPFRTRRSSDLVSGTSGRDSIYEVNQVIDQTGDAALVEGRRFLGQSVYLAIRERGADDARRGVTGLSDMLGRGSVTEIDNYLTRISGGIVVGDNITGKATNLGYLSGLGREVRNCMVTNPDLQGILDNLDILREGTNMASSDQREGLYQEMLNARRDIARMTGANRGERTMLLAYMNAEMENLNASGARRQQQAVVGGGAGGMGAMDELQREQLAYYKRQAELGKMVEATSYKEWLVALRDVDERTIPEAMWRYDPPSWINGTSVEDKRTTWRIYSATVNGMHIGAVRRRASEDLKSSPKFAAEAVMKLQAIPEKDIKFLYESGYGVKEAMETLVEDLLVEVVNDGGRLRPFNPRVDVKRIRGRDGRERDKQVRQSFFVFKDYGDTKCEAAERFRTDYSAYAKELAHKLWRGGAVVAEDQGILAAVAAVRIFEQGGVWDVADTTRRVDYSPDPLRTAMRPVEKFSRKIKGGERFGGNWNNYFRIITGGGDNPQLAADLARQAGYIPPFLAGSLLNYELDGNRGQTLGRLLAGKQEVEFASTTNDILFGFKKWWKAAMDVWSCTTGGKAFEVKGPDIREVDNIINEWVNPLVDAMAELRNHGVELTANEVVGAMGGAAGLWPFEGPYLRVTKYNDNPNFAFEYMNLGQEWLIRMGLPERISREVSDKFGFDNWGRMDDLNAKCADFFAEINAANFGFFRKALRKKRMNP